MKIVSALVRFSLTLLVLTLVGQVKVKGRTLESRYHSTVTSQAFQKSFWTITRPATWTYEKVLELLKNEEKASAR